MSLPDEEFNPDDDSLDRQADQTAESEDSVENELPVAELASDPVTAESESSDKPAEELTAEELRHRADQILEAQIAKSSLRKFSDLPPLADEFRSIAANGGAVTCLILGLIAFVGVWFTPWSAVNGVLAIPFAAWSVRSKMKLAGTIGICLAGIAMLIAFIGIQA